MNEMFLLVQNLTATSCNVLFNRVLHLNFSLVRMKRCFHGNQSEYQKKKPQRHSLIFNLLPGKFSFKFTQLFVR